jgi:hypothetical protein
VPAEFIDWLKSRENDYGLVDLPPLPRLRRGTKVKVLMGPLVGEVGLVQGMSSSTRVRIFLKNVVGASGRPGRRLTFTRPMVERIAA